jgi:SAM-dependent methyltransferase
MMATMTAPRMYAQLADWWPLVSDPADYEEEAGIYRRSLDELSQSPVRTLLELGSGGGNNASHLKAHYELTLVEPSMGMREVSRALNPECQHVPGDMRAVRLEQHFDAIFIHDAIMYMTTEEDLLAALRTAHAHCKPGGVALFVPDDTKETWRSRTHRGGHDRGGRALRMLEWTFDPDPDDTTFRCVFAFMLREGDGPVRYEHDEHVMGLFPRDTWLRLIEKAGFEPRALPYEHSTFEVRREMFAGLS